MITTYPKYEKMTTTKSFVYRSIDRFRDAYTMSSEDPFRDMSGENKPKIKRNNPHIIELVDELHHMGIISPGKLVPGKCPR